MPLRNPLHLLDEDDMASDSAAAVATQQSIKAYVDAQRYYGLTWDEDDAADTYARTGMLAGIAVGSSPGDAALPIHARRRRCVLSDAGEVQYYLNPNDSTKKVDGSASDLTGADGQVYGGDSVLLVQTFVLWHDPPLGHQRVSIAWIRSPSSLCQERRKRRLRYIGAYEGVLYDTSESKYVNGLYLPSDASYKMTFTNADDKIQSDTLTHPFTNLEVGVDKVVVSGTVNNNGTYDIVTQGDDFITIGAGGTLTNEANVACVIQTQRDWTATTGDVLGSVSGQSADELRHAGQLPCCGGQPWYGLAAA